ncbi:hypothetical protein F4780DRAFT_788886 [Xylariomycetidae sp. FL0641]|nr:hypothetical protein F4780DRAFT_788886 [Xylariomycetidae sp. FL0641]
MAVHYPLNGLDLDFHRYAHQPLGGRGCLINSIMERFMDPRQSLPSTFDPNVDSVEGPEPQIGVDLDIIRKVLDTDWQFMGTTLPARHFFDRLLCLRPRDIIHVEATNEFHNTAESIVVALVRQYFLENDPSSRVFLRQCRLLSAPVSEQQPWPDPWDQDMKARMGIFKKAEAQQNDLFLYSGQSRSSIRGPDDCHLYTGTCFLAKPFTLLRKARRTAFLGELDLHGEDGAELLFPEVRGLKRTVPRRSQSQPPPGAWTTASVSKRPSATYHDVVFFPRRPLSELDKRSRRRSLSRTHIRAMFGDKPDWGPGSAEVVPGGGGGASSPDQRCSNCAQPTHAARDCPSTTCGFCGSDAHRARQCPAPAGNRCKCRPFPQRHLARACPRPCSRRCGGGRHRGAAMLCAYRCCMCGARGHAGRGCALKRCRCGGPHLTQDCRWQVECRRAPGCALYLCHLHCRECGAKKDRASHPRFVGRTCPDCLQNGRRPGGAEGGAGCVARRAGRGCVDPSSRDLADGMGISAAHMR